MADGITDSMDVSLSELRELVTHANSLFCQTETVRRFLWVGTIKFLLLYNKRIRKCELFSGSTHLCFSKLKSKLR